MRSLGLLVVSLIAAGALSGCCCTQQCGVGGNSMCCSAGSACQTDCGSCDSGNCGAERVPCGIFGGRQGGRGSCNNCGDQSGSCGCSTCDTGRGGGGLLSGGFRGLGCCNSCGDQSGNCGCQTGAPLSCGNGRTGLLDRLGSRSSGCGCDQCGNSGGPFKFRSHGNACNTCGSQSGDCGCSQMNGGGSSYGDSSGRFGSGGVFGGVAQSSCNDCDNGWGASQAGGAMGDHFAGCGRNGCGMGGHLCSRCRARAMAGRHGRGAAGHPYGGMIPHTPSAQLEGQGPMTPTYVYPYYTTRGPRDFLMPNPPSIGY